MYFSLHIDCHAIVLNIHRSDTAMWQWCESRLTCFGARTATAHEVAECI